MSNEATTVDPAAAFTVDDLPFRTNGDAEGDDVPWA